MTKSKLSGADDDNDQDQRASCPTFLFNHNKLQRKSMVFRILSQSFVSWGPASQLSVSALSRLTIPIERAPGVPSAATLSTTSLYSKQILLDHSKDAIQFFTSIRIPAALIAGSSLGALFVLVDRSSHPEREKSKRELSVLFVYHLLAMISLVLSLNVIVTATSASNTMLIRNYNPAAASAYEFMMAEVPFEYLTTRWSFYTALICFLKAVMCRALLEFDILRKDRLRSALLVVSSMTGFASHVLHIVNDCLYSYSNLFDMTKGVIALYARRVWTQRSPMLIVACLSWITATGLFFSLLPRLAVRVRNAPDYQDVSRGSRCDDNNEPDPLDGVDLNVIDEVLDAPDLDEEQ